MAKKRIHTVVLVALVAGAVVLVLLLAGVGSGLLTNPTP
jgi:nitrogen fixation-related uncharacterized protein